MLANNFGVEWLNIELPFACDIHFSYPRADAHSDRFQVLWLFSEPEPIRLNEQDFAANWQRYDLIISHDIRHLQYPNVVRGFFWDTWATELPAAKRFEVSNIFSIGRGPTDLHGYLDRVEVINRNNEITVPKQFFISRRYPNWQLTGFSPLVNDKRDCLFESMFNICIENVVEDDYFTEKLLDCFNTYTVPIYKGCRNLSDHGLLEDAIIRFETVDECIAVCNRLTLADYYSRLPSLDTNRRVLRTHSNCLELARDLIIESSEKWSRARVGTISLP